MTKHGLDAPVELRGGSWQPQGAVLVWVPEKSPDEAPTQVGLLIACPSCHAKVGQSCRTRTGHTTTPHSSRLVPRLCQCGRALAPRKRYCDPCRRYALQASKNEHGRRNQEIKNAWGRAWRAARREATWLG